MIIAVLTNRLDRLIMLMCKSSLYLHRQVSVTTWIHGGIDSLFASGAFFPVGQSPNVLGIECMASSSSVGESVQSSGALDQQLALPPPLWLLAVGQRTSRLIKRHQWQGRNAHELPLLY